MPKIYAIYGRERGKPKYPPWAIVAVEAVSHAEALKKGRNYFERKVYTITGAKLRR